MKVEINGDLYDEEVIAFVRKLNKKTKDWQLEDGSVIPGGKAYVVQLKHGYSLDARGNIRSVFLSQEEGERLIEVLRPKRGQDAPSTQPA